MICLRAVRRSIDAATIFIQNASSRDIYVNDFCIEIVCAAQRNALFVSDHRNGKRKTFFCEVIPLALGFADFSTDHSNAGHTERIEMKQVRLASLM